MKNSDGIAKSSVGFVQLLSDKTTTTLKSTTLETHSVRAIHVNVSGRRRNWLIGNKHKPVRFLPVYCTQEQLEDEECAEDEEMSV